MNIRKPTAQDNNIEQILNPTPMRPGRPRKNDSTLSQTILMEMTSPPPAQQKQKQQQQQQQQQPAYNTFLHVVCNSNYFLSR